MKSKKEESNCPLPYEIQIVGGRATSTGDYLYVFYTDEGLEYSSAFFEYTETFFQYGPPIEGLLFEFSFGTKVPVKGLKPDPRIKETVVQLLHNFSLENPYSAVAYVCDNEDGKARGREILFRRWFAAYNTEEGNPIHHESLQVRSNSSLTANLFIRNDNPGKREFLRQLKIEVGHLVIAKDAA